MPDRSIAAHELEDDHSLPTDEAQVLEVKFPAIQHFHLPTGAFGRGSAFPAPGVLPFVRELHRQAEQLGSSRIVVFGYADTQSAGPAAKKVSERRARAVLALLQRDLDAFDALAKADGWGLWQYQAMLRALRLNPGAIDGREGPLTGDALRVFQKAYGEGAYHEAQDAPPRRGGKVPVSGTLTDETRAAIRDAYLACLPRGLPASCFARPAFAGCGGLGHAASADVPPRYASVAFVEDVQRCGTFPCKEGAPAACPASPGPPRFCTFWRKHFRWERGLPPGEPFYDMHWLRDRAGDTWMSALTRLPDQPHVRFTILRWQEKLPEKMPSSSEAPEKGQKEPPVSVVAEVDGAIRGGVAWARWRPEGFEPFDFHGWLVDHPISVYSAFEEGPSEPEPTGPGVYPSVFKIEARGEWRISRPPGIRLDRIRIQEAKGGLAIRDDGALVAWTVKDGKPAPVKDDGKPVHVIALATPAGMLMPVEREGS